jgi:N-hydroxyarylamine O-acetyltransferase
MFELDAYLERVGLPGVRGATLDTLRAVHSAHPEAIPFENLNPLLGWPVALDIDSLQRKMVAEGRGGWCFEHNALFRAALEALGFEVTSLGARVLWNAPPGSPVGARSHMLLRVEAEGRGYLCDVGFGGNVLTAPLAWEPGVEQKTPHEPHRILPFENGYVLEAFIAGAWLALYRFTAEPQFPSDYEVSNWFLCTHESSFFRNTLLAARATPECRYALRNNALAIHRATGTEKRVLADAAALQAVLAGEMAIRLPDGAELDAALERLVVAKAE